MQCHHQSQNKSLLSAHAHYCSVPLLLSRPSDPSLPIPCFGGSRGGGNGGQADGVGPPLRDAYELRDARTACVRAARRNRESKRKLPLSGWSPVRVESVSERVNARFRHADVRHRGADAGAQLGLGELDRPRRGRWHHVGGARARLAACPPAAKWPWPVPF